MNHIFQASVLIMECIELNWLCKHIKRSEAANQPFLYWIEWNTSLSLWVPLIQLSKAHHILRKRVDLNFCSLHTCNMWAYTKFIYSYTPFQLQKERKTDSVKIQTAQKQISIYRDENCLHFWKHFFEWYYFCTLLLFYF